MTLRSGSKFRFRPKLIFSSRKLRDAASNSRAIAAMAHDPSDDASLLRPALGGAELIEFIPEFMIDAVVAAFANTDDARADALSRGAVLDEDVFDIEMERKAAGTKGEPNEDVDDGAAYQDDYADILVEEAENRYKDILDYRDYEYVDDRWNNDWDDDAPSDDAVATH